MKRLLSLTGYAVDQIFLSRIKPRYDSLSRIRALPTMQEKLHDRVAPVSGMSTAAGRAMLW
jgi:hypothetical protein